RPLAARLPRPRRDRHAPVRDVSEEDRPGSRVSPTNDARGVSPTFADVNRDVVRTLEPPGSLYFAWMCVVALILAAGILAWTGQIWWGMGMAGKRTPQMWAMYITSFVFWIGIG